ncbi:DUF4192 domain-containing protein [Nocardia uniformis]|uniref:DUF4192 domain-containing protein n=1 Tax=Nocardia uniformis TaxID=53432 RepID=A0A849CB03_9NOCA|nr:DUF4192 domain-containing protein [Nocardia uniformis]NNH76023.1 DUF4192 domain-containing protein [Nocardia uniformis]
MSSDSRITELGDLIAALPAVLGFTPERSLVVVTLKRSVAGLQEVDVVIRVDLPTRTERSDADDIARRIALACTGFHVVAALAVVVDDRLIRPSTRAGRAHRRLLAVLEQHLGEVGTELTGAWAVAGIRADAPWWNLRQPHHRGTLPDPTASRVAVKRVLAALPMHRRRDELAGLIAVDEALRDQVAAVLPTAVAEAQQRLARDLRIGNPDAYSRKALWRVMEAIKQLDDPRELTPADLAEVATALGDTAVRDCMFGVARGRYAVAAEQLWTILTRALPDSHRAEAATLLAFSAYLRGDGPLAGIVLKAALAADPEHRMARLLDVALQAAFPPGKLGKVVRCGIETAAACGRGWWCSWRCR